MSQSTSQSRPIVRVSHLTKRFGQLTAVDDLSFDVKSGEAVALWGANGAGKTTAIRCLLNLMPFEGEATILGANVKKEGKAARRLIGFVPQELNFHDDLTVAETLVFYARLKKLVSGHDFSPLLNQLELTPYLERAIRDLSGGLKQRLALALALLSDPPVLVLDEPTSNLDIRAREEFLGLLNRLKEDGKTMVFSSHRLEEVTALADRVLLLEAGKLVVDSPPNMLGEKLGWESTLHLFVSEGAVEPALETLTAHGLPVSRNGRGVRVRVRQQEKLRVFRMLQAAGIEVEDFTLE